MKEKDGILTKYQCDNCSELHDERAAARECCPVEIWRVYICSVCDEQFDNLSSANAHFAKIFGNAPWYGEHRNPKIVEVTR